LNINPSDLQTIRSYQLLPKRCNRILRGDRRRAQGFDDSTAKAIRIAQWEDSIDGRRHNSMARTACARLVEEDAQAVPAFPARQG
jgi:hypothetical protein